MKLKTLIFIIIFFSCINFYGKNKKNIFPKKIKDKTCKEYLNTLKKTGGDKVLEKILNYRPHEYNKEENKKNLKKIPIKYMPKEKIRHPRWHPRVHKDVYDSLISMLEAARNEGHKITIQSGFRSIYEQNIIWQMALKKYNYDFKKAAYKVAPPCYSEHATGRAVDFALVSTKNKIKHDPAIKWIRKNNKKYGWFQTFHEDKIYTSRNPNWPGIMIEDWHFRHISINY
jgi:LAS superfamily LD-carboxypeptidase LdcB